jgi:integrase
LIGMVSKRRGHGEGLIRKRSDGRWEGRLDTGQYGEGRQRKSVYGRTRADVVDKLRQARAVVDQGLPVVDERIRLDAYLETWLEEVVKPARSRATWQGYEVNVRRHIAPLIGHRRLAKVSAADIQSVLNAKRAEGLAPRTVQYIHATMRAALGVAYRWGLVARNVATLVEPVTVDRLAVVPFTGDEVSKLLDAAAGHRLGAFYTVAIALGLRPSEALALSWSDIDMKAGTVRVRRVLAREDGQWFFREPKSRTGRRAVPLPGVCAEALKAHRKRQLEERMLAGELWEQWDLVFTTLHGRPLCRTEVSHEFSTLQRRAGVSHHRLYDSRHTAASLLLAQGVSPRVVMEILGHSSFALTMDTYTHVMTPLLRDAAEAMDRALRRT